jgi:hypothetical protein
MRVAIVHDVRLTRAMRAAQRCFVAREDAGYRANRPIPLPAGGVPGNPWRYKNGAPKDAVFNKQICNQQVLAADATCNIVDVVTGQADVSQGLVGQICKLIGGLTGSSSSCGLC